MSNAWNTNSYRQEQEMFMFGHGGTTSREVIFTIMPSICAILLTTTTIYLLRKVMSKNIKIILEFILIVIPSILCCTVLSEYTFYVCSIMLLISMTNILLLVFKPNLSFTGEVKCTSKRTPFITNFRALTNMLTAICILAVDFHIFPRKFAKTETFGYSIMDTGVGLFVLANAIVAPETKDFISKPRLGFFHTIFSNIKCTSKSCIPLLVLGIGRSVAIEFLGYQKHTTEYGVHWNFFITLGFVKLFSSSITGTINSKYSLWSGIWIIGMHEYILSTKGLKEWVLSNRSRSDFISANREGIVSVPGYVGLYLIGVTIGRLIHSTYQNSQTQSSMQQRYKTVCVKLFGYEFDVSYNKLMILCIKLSLISAEACAATLFCNSYFKVSRRLANAGYCMWILTLGVMLLVLLLLIEIISDILIHTSIYPAYVNQKTKSYKANMDDNQECELHILRKTIDKDTIEIFEAINYNGLFFFLISNLATGCINMLFKTLYLSQPKALLTLILYMALNIILALLLYRKQIQIKL